MNKKTVKAIVMDDKSVAKANTKEQYLHTLESKCIFWSSDCSHVHVAYNLIKQTD